MSRSAKIFVNNQEAALLEESVEGEYCLQYQSDYLQKYTAPISLKLPVRAEPYYAKQLFPFFDGLIPEGWLLEIAEKNWKLDPNDRMGLLLAFCQDCIGNVHVIAVKEAV